MLSSSRVRTGGDRCGSVPPGLHALLLRSKRLKGVATVVINICMLAHVPTTYVYEWFCAGNIGPHAPRGTTFYSVAACEGELGRTAEYCERWRDTRNASMTLLFAPPADSCPSVGLSLYNARAHTAPALTTTERVCARLPHRSVCAVYVCVWW